MVTVLFHLTKKDCDVYIDGYRSEVPLSRSDNGTEVAMEYIVPMEADRTIGMESLDYLESSIEGLVVIVAYAVGHVLGIPDPSRTEQPLSWQRELGGKASIVIGCAVGIGNCSILDGVDVVTCRE